MKLMLHSGRIAVACLIHFLVRRADRPLEALMLVFQQGLPPVPSKQLYQQPNSLQTVGIQLVGADGHDPFERGCFAQQSCPWC